MRYCVTRDGHYVRVPVERADFPGNASSNGRDVAGAAAKLEDCVLRAQRG
ncbi:MAG: hypothetical protein M0T77_05725 [Actinomycetota bacterium]|nr:hypothetical protein [Actinomycetota bacterium]